MRPPLPLGTSSDDLTWPQVLAVRVIQQAVWDATDRNRVISLRARAFLQPTSAGLQFWCAVAGLNPALMRTRVANLE